LRLSHIRKAPHTKETRSSFRIILIDGNIQAVEKAKHACILVERIMTTDLVTAQASTSLVDIIAALHEHNIRHMPVTDNHGTLCGIISNRDMLVAHIKGKNVEGESRATHIMTRDVVTIRPDMCARVVARRMYDSKLGSLPVVDENMKLIGIITEADFVALFAANAPCACDQAAN